MKRLISLFLIFAFAGWSLASANVKFQAEGKISFAEGGRICPGDTPEILISGDVTATMTSNTAPSPNVITYSMQSAPYYAWQAFDGSTSTRWLCNSFPGWIKYNWGAGNSHHIVKLAIKSYSNAYPKNIGIYGSNDDSAYTHLASSTLANNTNWQTVTWENTTKHQYIKIYIADSYNASADPVEIELWEQL